MKKRVLSIFLALFLCMGMAVPAYANQAAPAKDEIEKKFFLSYEAGGHTFQCIKNGDFSGTAIRVEKQLLLLTSNGNQASARQYVAVASDTTFTVKHAGAEDEGFIIIYLSAFVNVGGIYIEDTSGDMVLTPHGFAPLASASSQDDRVVLFSGDSAQFELPPDFKDDDTVYALELRYFYPVYYPSFRYSSYSAGAQCYMIDDAAVDAYIAEHAPTPAFTDVPASQWYAAPVAWAVENKITNGTSDTTFSPSQDCTQAQILTFLYRADRGQGPATAADMDKAVEWAKEKGIIDNTFDGTKPCTRATAVRYIWQALGKESAKASSFTDVPANADYADAVSWAVESGITNGDGSDTIFSPDKVCSRGHIVTFLHRAYVEEARLTAK